MREVPNMPAKILHFDELQRGLLRYGDFDNSGVNRLAFIFRRRSGFVEEHCRRTALKNDEHPVEKRRINARRPENRMQRLLKPNPSRDVEQHAFLTHRRSERGE